MKQADPKRFRKGIDGRYYDTQMHPKVKAAQDAEARRQARAKKSKPEEEKSDA